MKKARTKFLSLLLVLCMVISMIPVAVFAAEVSDEGDGAIVGGYVYTLDTDGYETGSDNKYLFVASNAAYAMDEDASGVVPVTLSSDGSTATVSSRDYEWYITTYRSGRTTYYPVTKNGSTWIYHENYGMHIGTNDNGYWSINEDDQDEGLYRFSNVDGSTWYLYYDSTESRMEVSTSNSNRVRLYKYSHEAEGDTVEFAATLASGTVMKGASQTVEYTITLGSGETVTAADITWASGNTAAATVENGTVTGVDDGSATITATLNSVNGKALATPIVLELPITVQSKAIKSYALKGSPVTVVAGETPDYSGVYLEVTYEDDTTGKISYENLDFGDVDTATPGTKTVVVTYGSNTYNLTVNVVISYDGLDPATDYPEYPEDGAVRINKTAKELDFEDTGVVEVELDVAGVSVKKAVDAVLTIDISNSMAWETGTTTDNFEANKLNDVMAAVKTFAEILLADNDDGTPTNNTITIVTFAGYDADNSPNEGTYVDSVRTLVTKTSSMDVIESITSNTKFTGRDGDYTIQLAYIPADEDQNTADNVTTDSGANRGDTNYDYAFWQTNKAIEDGGLGGTGRDIYVLFMTDGCASNYNGTYYRTSNKGYYYKPGTTTEYDATTTYTNGTAWTNYINNTLIANNGGNTYAKTLYQNIAGMYAVGFDMANGAFSGIGTWDGNTDWESVFNNIVSKSVTDSNGNGLIPVTAASDTATLKSFYESMGRALRYAGTAAQVTDTVDSEFTLQMAATSGSITTEDGVTSGRVADLATYGITPHITVKAYDLWTKEETDDTALIGTRQTDADGNYIFTTLETVTFNADGTEAYSDKIGNTTNIMTVSGGTTTISAKTFTYTKTADGVETFKWIIGNITDAEIALSYTAYLKNSLEGTEPKGLKYTNEEAKLEYIDINGDYAYQYFPIPAVAWGGASTAYEFYLVNEDGQPCDRDGNVVPFANRVIITGPYYEELYLNQGDQNKAQEIVAAYVLPAGYTLYDSTAKYTVTTSSGTVPGSLVISDPASGKAQTTILVTATAPSYIQSHVAFGVMYNQIPDEADFQLTPDQVVIDYGKPIVVNIANGNDDLEDGYSATLVGFSKYYDTVNLKQKFSNTPYEDNFKTTYGTFSIESNGANNTESKVRYTPTDIVDDVEMVFCVIEMYSESKNDTYYMVDWLTVIPATNVYYETDFATGVFTNDTASAWSQVNDPSASTESKEIADATQNDGTIGVGQTYGYDTTYTDDAYLSDGDSWFVNGQGYANTYTTFSFEGTGFELYSRTGTEQGLIKAEVFMEDGTNVKSVSVLNKSDSSLELYQIPVISVNDLAYGNYDVRISVNTKYDNANFPALYRGNEFYFDAIRIYDPAQDEDVALTAYAADGEAKAVINEVRGKLLEAETFEAIEAGNVAEEEGMVFIDKTQDGVVISDYATIGPNNEVYLSNGQAIAFKMDVATVPASFDIGAKAITGNSADLKVTITDKTNSWTVEETITSSSAQFINLMTAAANADVFGGEVYVIITNPDTSTETKQDTGVLSITDIKAAWSGTVATAFALDLASEEEAYDPYAVSYTVDAGTFALARTVLTASEEVPEETVPEETVPEETEPEATEPEATEPEVTEPEATEPEVTEPEVTEPEATEPEATEPEATEPEYNYQETVNAIINKIVKDLTDLLNWWFK